MTKRSVSLCLLLAAITTHGVLKTSAEGSLDYFKATALQDADMRGISEEIDSILGRAPMEFALARSQAAMCSGHARNRIAARIEIATRLVHYIEERHSADPAKRDCELLAYQGACELETFYGYFHAEAELKKRRSALGMRREYDLVRDFGGVGDGKTDNGPAFCRAFEAMCKAGGNATLTLPNGVFLIEPVKSSLPDDRYVFPAWKNAGIAAGPVSRASKDFDGAVHLVLPGLSHAIIRGAGRSEIRLADPSVGGFAFLGCYDVVLKDVSISYAGNCSTQGEVVEVGSDGAWVLMRRQKGYPDPSSGQFIKAGSHRFTRCLPPDNLFDAGSICICGEVEDVDGDLFRLMPCEGTSLGNWRKIKTGDRIAMIARYSEGIRGSLVWTDNCAFFGVEGVTVFDAPGQVFVLNGGFAPHIIGCSVRPRPGTDDLVSSNADGFFNYGSFAAYVADSFFTRMEDDGCNVGYGGGAVEKGIFHVDCVDGRIVRFERPDAKGCFRPEQRVVPDVQKLREFQHNISIGNFSAKCDVRKEMTFPGNSGFVIRNCTFIENRGMGLQAHAPNSLIENCTMQRLTGPAASINPLIGWGLVSNPHNTLVRNCHAIDCSRGFVLAPGNVPVGVDCSQRMIHSVDVVGCDFGGFGDRSVVDSASSLAIGVDDARFRLSLKQVKDDTIDVISSDDARSLKAWQTADGVLKIEFSYSARPVKTVIASVRTNTEGAKCYRLEIGFDAGWELRGIDYPIVRVETVKGLNFILGSTLGDSFADMEAKPLGWRCERLWPSQADAQFMALWTAEHGVYVGVEDAASCPKLLTGERVQRGMEVFSRAEVAATNNYVQPYDIVVRKMRKIPGGNPLTWREFADVYKAWDAQPHR